MTNLQRVGDWVIFRIGLGTEDDPDDRYYQTDGSAAGTVLAPWLDFARGLHFLDRTSGDPVLLFWDLAASELHAATQTTHQVLLQNVPHPSSRPNTGSGQGSAFVTGGHLYHVGTNLQLHVVMDYIHIAPTCLTLPGGDTFYGVDPGNGSEIYFARQGYIEPTLVADIAPNDILSSNPRPTGTAAGFLALLGDGSLQALDGGATAATPVDAGPFDWLAATAGRLFLTSRGGDRRLSASTGGAALDLGIDQISTLEFNQPAAFEGRLYFTTDELGQDLNVSDGSLAGTHLLHDVEPGWAPPCEWDCEQEALASFPRNIVADSQRLFWDRHYHEPGLPTAGVGEGGFSVVGLAAPGPTPRFIWQGTSYFTAGLAGPELWEVWASDGSDAGTRRLAALAQLASPPTRFAHHAGGVFFVVERLGVEELWRTDGTPAGTGRFFDFGASAVFGELLATPTHLFLAVATPGPGAELWAIAGGAPYLVRDIHPGARSSYPHEFHRAEDGRLIFAAADNVFGAEPWISDGTPDGTRILADIAPGSSGPQSFAERERRLVFSADDGVRGRELWTLLPAVAPFFADGFETGDTGRWTTHSPP